MFRRPKASPKPADGPETRVPTIARMAEDRNTADAFYNNGATSGSLRGTPFVDPAVGDC